MKTIVKNTDPIDNTTLAVITAAVVAAAGKVKICRVRRVCGNTRGISKPCIGSQGRNKFGAETR